MAHPEGPGESGNNHHAASDYHWHSKSSMWWSAETTTTSQSPKRTEELRYTSSTRPAEQSSKTIAFPLVWMLLAECSESSETAKASSLLNLFIYHQHGLGTWRSVLQSQHTPWTIRDWNNLSSPHSQDPPHYLIAQDIPCESEGSFIAQELAPNK